MNAATAISRRVREARRLCRRGRGDITTTPGGRPAEGTADEYAGLARIWINATPRLGMVGVRQAYRRKGLARVLIGRAFDAMIEMGVLLVVAEVDTGNEASNALMASLGARVTSQSIEMRREE